MNEIPNRSIVELSEDGVSEVLGISDRIINVRKFKVLDGTSERIKAVKQKTKGNLCFVEYRTTSIFLWYEDDKWYAVRTPHIFKFIVEYYKDKEDIDLRSLSVNYYFRTVFKKLIEHNEQMGSFKTTFGSIIL